MLWWQKVLICIFLTMGLTIFGCGIALLVVNWPEGVVIRMANLGIIFTGALIIGLTKLLED